MTPEFIFHGRRDENVNYEQSVLFAKRGNNVSLRLVNSDHLLLDQLDNIWSAAVQFFDLCIIHPVKPHFITQVYYLGNAADINRFKTYEDRFLEVFEAAYGDKFYRRTVHLNRIYGKDHTWGAHYIFLVFDKSVGKRNLVGCSYIRPDGKRGATAVLPEYQGHGVGRQLICASFKLFESQFTEISPSDLIMRRLLVSLGFRPVTSESELRHYLSRGAHLLRSIRYQEPDLLYTRSIAACPDTAREFVMFKYQRDFQ